VSNTGEKGKVMAEAFMEFVNGATTKDKAVFVQTILRDHRALQQEAFNVMIDTCKAWSELDASDHYDARNQHAVKTSVEIMKAVGEWVNK
jgi:hypothetical protein